MEGFYGIVILVCTIIGGFVGELMFTPPHVLIGMGIGFIVGIFVCCGNADDALDMITGCFHHH